MNLGYQPSLHHIAEMVAMDKGWFLEDLEPFGVTDVDEFEFPTGPPEMQAMLAGHLDVAYVGIAPPITAIDQGLDARIVAAVNIQGSNLVLRNGVEYNGPESLIGLNIGTFPPGSIQDIILRKWLKDNGVDTDNVRISPMSAGDAITAIYAGKIDGTMLPQPSPAIIEVEGKGKSVVSSGEMWPNHACCCILVSGKLIREEPELVKQLVMTHERATQYVNEHPEEAAEIYSRKTGQNLDQVKYAIKTWDGKWIADPSVQIESALEYASIDYDLNYTEKQMTEEDLFDTSFYEPAGN